MDRTATIRTEAQRFADVLAATAPDARCPTCPDWSASDLLWHLTSGAFLLGRCAGAQRPASNADIGGRRAGEARRGPGAMPDLLALRAQATAALLQPTRIDSTTPSRGGRGGLPDQTVGFTRTNADLRGDDAPRRCRTDGRSLPVGPDQPRRGCRRSRPRGRRDVGLAARWRGLPGTHGRRVRRHRRRQALAGRGRGGIRQPSARCARRQG